MTRPADVPWWKYRTDSRFDLRLEWPGPAKAVDPTVNPDWVDVILPLDGRAMARVRLHLVDGETARVGFEVYDPTGDLTTRLLRQASSGLVEKIDGLLEEWLVEHIIGGEWRRQVKRPGRAGRPDMFYAEWAARYVSALETDPKAPVKRLVAEEEDARRFATESQIRAYLTKARGRGLLTKSEPGVAGGRLTAKGRRALERAGITEGMEK